MAFIFASNPDSLAGQRNFYDQQNIAVAERDQALRQQALNDAASRAWEQQNQEQQRAYQFTVNQQSRQDQAAANAQNRSDQYFQFATQRQDKTAADAENKRRFDVGLDLSKAEVDAKKAQYDYSKAQNDYSKAQNDYSQAYNDIMTGTIAKPEDIKSLYPNLSQLDVNRAQAALNAKTKNEMESYNQIDSGAKAATGYIRSMNLGTPEKSGHWYQFGAGGAAAVPPKQFTEEEAMDALAKNSKSFGKILPHIQWDESSQSFTPSMPKPAFSPLETPNVPRGTSATSSPTTVPPTSAIIPVNPASVPGPVAASPQPPLDTGSGEWTPDKVAGLSASGSPVGPVLAANGQPIPATHIGALLSRIVTPAMFDAKYGPGSAQRVMTAESNRMKRVIIPPGSGPAVATRGIDPSLRPMTGQGFQFATSQPSSMSVM